MIRSSPKATNLKNTRSNKRLKIHAADFQGKEKPLLCDHLSQLRENLSFDCPPAKVKVVFLCCCCKFNDENGRWRMFCWWCISGELCDLLTIHHRKTTAHIPYSAPMLMRLNNIAKMLDITHQFHSTKYLKYVSVTSVAWMLVEKTLFKKRSVGQTMLLRKFSKHGATFHKPAFLMYVFDSTVKLSKKNLKCLISVMENKKIIKDETSSVTREVHFGSCWFDFFTYLSTPSYTCLQSDFLITQFTAVSLTFRWIVFIHCSWLSRTRSS